MYSQLSDITTKYGSEFYLKQSMHPFNTQSNEALNQSQACLTPKSKSFHESKSFSYCHAIIVGVHNWGMHKYWTEVFTSMGVPYSPFFSNHLCQVDERRKRWKEYHGKRDVKRKRAHKQQATEKRLIYESRTTEYAAGLGLDIGNPTQAVTPARAKKPRTKRTQCKCGSTTHLTSRSKECKYNKNNLRSMELCGEVRDEEGAKAANDEKFEEESI